MQRFGNVLVVPLELRRSDPAVSAACELAERTGAELTLFLLRHESAIRRAKLLARLRSDGIKIHAVAAGAGDHATLILERARSHDHDLILKTSRVGDAPSSRFYSPVAARLLQSANCPVWILKSNPRACTPKVLAAVGPFDRENETRVSDTEILSLASELAELRRAELHIVSALTPLPKPRHVPPTYYNDYIGGLREDAVRALQQLVDRVAPDVPASHVHLLRGQADDVIARVADDLDAELVVVGAAGRTGLRRWLFGNTVEGVLARTRRDTVGVRSRVAA